MTRLEPQAGMDAVRFQIPLPTALREELTTWVNSDVALADPRCVILALNSLPFSLAASSPI